MTSAFIKNAFCPPVLETKSRNKTQRLHAPRIRSHVHHHNPHAKSALLCELRPPPIRLDRWASPVFSIRICSLSSEESVLCVIDDVKPRGGLWVLRPLRLSVC